jgi:hypothetical protein
MIIRERSFIPGYPNFISVNIDFTEEEKKTLTFLEKTFDFMEIRRDIPLSRLASGGSVKCKEFIGRPSIIFINDNKVKINPYAIFTEIASMMRNRHVLETIAYFPKEIMSISANTFNYALQTMLKLYVMSAVEFSQSETKSYKEGVLEYLYLNMYPYGKTYNYSDFNMTFHLWKTYSINGNLVNIKIPYNVETGEIRDR